jgi:hypothetical protein
MEDENKKEKEENFVKSSSVSFINIVRIFQNSSEQNILWLNSTMRS